MSVEEEIQYMITSKTSLTVLALTITIMSLSCTSNEVQKDINVNLNDLPAIPLKGELMEELLLTPYTKSMKHIQSHLFHFTPIHGISCLVTNENADTIGYLAPIGNGPGEFISAWPDFAGISQNEDTIYLYDTSIRTVKTYNLNVTSEKVSCSFIDKKKLQENGRPNAEIIDWGINRLKRLDNGYFVGFCDLSTGHTFSLFNKDLEEITKFGEYPIQKGLEKDELYFIPFFDGSLEVKGNSIYHATRAFPYMARYDINEKGEVTKVWEGLYANVHCYLSNRSLKFKANNTEGFYSLAVGEKYLFAAYSGVESGELHRQRSGMALYPRTLVVFDLYGNPLKKFKLEGRFVPICLDSKEEYLYVQHDDPDTSLWRYKISDIEDHLQDLQEKDQSL